MYQFGLQIMAGFQVLLLLLVFTLLPAFVTSEAPPSCFAQNSLLSSENRQTILNNFNQRRSEVLNGTLLLNNGQYALQAEQMPMLSWDCDLEAAMQEVVGVRCPVGTFQIENETSYFIFENLNTIDYYANNLSKTEANYLTFLTNSTKSILPNLRAQRVIHDKATKVGCAIEQCLFESYTPPIPGPRELIYKPRTILLCRFDVNLLKTNTPIYNARTNATTTVSPIITSTPGTQTTPCNSENDVIITKAKALSLIEGKEMVIACGMLFGYIEAGSMDATVLDSPEFEAYKSILTSLGLLA